MRRRRVTSALAPVPGLGYAAPMLRFTWALPLCVTLGCTSIQIAPGESVELEPEQGLLVLGADAESIVHMHITAPSRAGGFTFRPFFRGKNLKVARTVAGRHCISEIATQAANILFEDPPCVEVVPGAATLVGLQERGQKVVGAMPIPEVEAAFASDYPDLAQRYPVHQAVAIPPRLDALTDDPT